MDTKMDSVIQSVTLLEICIYTTNIWNNYDFFYVFFSSRLYL